MAFFDKNKLGELRPNQIITTFGPGSVVDAVKDSVTVLDISSPIISLQSSLENPFITLLFVSNSSTNISPAAEVE